MGCGDYLVVLVLLVVYSCVAFTVVESAVVPLPESVLRWFGIAGEEAGSCGPQLEIATPACKVVETRKEYELRKYKTEVSLLDPGGSRILWAFFGVCVWFFVSTCSSWWQFVRWIPVLSIAVLIMCLLKV